MEPVVLDIRDTTQFAVDERPFAAMQGLVRRFHQMQKPVKGPVVDATEPWEGTFLAPVSVMRDEASAGWKMWYGNYGERKQPVQEETNHLAFSKDGIHWEKPSLGAWKLGGDSRNNLVVFADRTVKGACAVFDDPDEPDKTRRYKMIYYLPNYYLAYSPDGIHWKPAQKDPVWPNGSGDGLEETYFFLRDTIAGGYRGYMRVWRRHQTIRKLGLGDSGDLLKWSGPGIIWEAVPEWGIGAQIYGMNVWTEGGVYWGLPWIFYGDEPLDLNLRQNLRLKLAWSRDGQQWQAVFPDQDAMPMGEPGSFDAGMVLSTCPMVELPDRLRLYYYGSHGLHDGSAIRSAIGLAEIRRGGFVSLHADGEGSLVTHRFLLRGEELRINAQTGKKGYVEAELLNDYGSIMDGFEAGSSDRLSGDTVDHVLTWKGKGNLAFLRGQYIRLRLVMKDADLYSFRVAGTREMFAAPIGPSPVRCGRCMQPPVIDGKLSEECWMDFRNSGIADDFVKFTEAVKSPVKTRVMMTRDEGNLYISVDCEEPLTDKLTASRSSGEVNYTNDEVVEFRLSSPEHGTHFHQLMVTFDGRKQHCWFSKEAGGAKVFDRAEWEAKTSSVAGRWYIEMAVPFKSLTTPSPKAGEQWKMNVIRYRRVAGEDISCWCCMFGSVHRNDVSGTVVFV